MVSSYCKQTIKYIKVKDIAWGAKTRKVKTDFSTINQIPIKITTL